MKIDYTITLIQSEKNALINCYNKAMVGISTENEDWTSELKSKFCDMLIDLENDENDDDDKEFLESFFDELNYCVFGDDSFSYDYITEIIVEIAKGNTKIENYNITIVEGE